MVSQKEKLQNLLKTHVIKCGSQTKLAEQIGIKAGTLNTYLRGESYPDTGNLNKIAKYLGVSLETLEEQLRKPDSPKSIKVKEKKAIYQVDTSKAEGLFLICADLPAEEKIRLAKHLLDVAVS
ncbi:helix-turn-helix transcriptional regulator [Pannus brasiliensis CCIBt3594]|uniref:Helix-turn-helix transcriptional regulator n=1 Tax=Pannus brasiliensis CCIBt3594 TaxID=1427578 RepID=A0AAW9QXV3_9CHRO